MQVATARAQEYATLVGAQLGDVIVVAETQLGGVSPLSYYGRGGDVAQSAVVAPGQNNVQIQVNVTFRITR